MAKTIAINAHGEIRIEQDNSETSDSDDDQARYLSYIAKEDFETLDTKNFRLGEIANLLASSDLR